MDMHSVYSRENQTVSCIADNICTVALLHAMTATQMMYRQLLIIGPALSVVDINFIGTC